MIQEDKELLLKDLCARLPYKVKIMRYVERNNKINELIPELNLSIRLVELFMGNNEFIIKPYLRPMSSMTEEEKNNLQSLHDIISDENYEDGHSPSAWNAITEWEDYCNARHLDYRGLIPKGLALEAKEGMYNL